MNPWIIMHKAKSKGSDYKLLTMNRIVSVRDLMSKEICHRESDRQTIHLDSNRHHFPKCDRVIWDQLLESNQESRYYACQSVRLSIEPSKGFPRSNKKKSAITTST